MNIHIDSDFIEIALPIFIFLLILITIISVISLCIIKNSDNKKPAKTRKCKIIEKPVQQGNIEWYIVEFENGERTKLRNFNANKLIISIGDIGIIKYKGQTIVSFQRTDS